MSAGFDFPSFQLNWMYPAAIASLTLWYDANVDFFDRVDVGCWHCQPRTCCLQTCSSWISLVLQDTLVCTLDQ